MFYYYQVRNHHYTTEAYPYLNCPMCGTTGYLHMSIMQKYTWMIGPMAPSAKYAVAWCQHCLQYIPKVKWTDEMDAAYVASKKGLKTPARLYRGIWVMPLVVAAFIGTIVGGIYFTNNRQRTNQAFVQAATLQPQQGDIFQINHSNGQTTFYTYYKVARTTSDSVYIQEATQHPADIKQWDNIPNTESAYAAKQIAFSLADIKKMDGMFSSQENGTPVYGLVWGVWRAGKLHKKY